MHGEPFGRDHHRLPRARAVGLVLGLARRQVETLGGTWTGARHDYDEGVVMVMQDPEEHEFCLVRHYGPAVVGPGEVTSNSD